MISFVQCRWYHTGTVEKHVGEVEVYIVVYTSPMSGLVELAEKTLLKDG